MQYPAILIPCWNRPASLHRLLKSLAESHVPDGVALVFCPDAEGDPEVIRIAESFEWKSGRKEIRTAPRHLGLKENILRCGGMTAEFGAVIVLEDDLAVSPYFFSWVNAGLKFFKDHSSVKSISLYHYPITETCFQPFLPIEDGSDVYFLRHPSSWGQVWTKESWIEFEEWSKNNLFDPEILPPHIRAWTEQSWKKIYAAFLMDVKGWVAFPRISLTTNFEDEGTHASTTNLFQAEILDGEKNWKLHPPEISSACYDAYFEWDADCLKKRIPSLKKYNLELDLQGIKEKISADYVITIRRSKNPIRAWGLRRQPDIANIIYDEPGNELMLLKKEDRGIVIPPIETYPYRYRSFYRDLYNQVKGDVETSLRKELIPVVQDRLYREMKFMAERFPEIILLVPMNDEKKPEQYASELHAIAYPFLKIVFVQENGSPGLRQGDGFQVFGYTGSLPSAVSSAGNAVTGDLVIIYFPGQSIPASAMHEAGAIFRKFPQVDWFLGLEVKGKSAVPPADFSAPELRFDPLSLERRLKRKKQITSCRIVFRKHLLNKFPKDSIDFGTAWNEFLLTTIQYHPLYLAMLNLSSSIPKNQNSKLALPETGIRFDPVRMALRPLFVMGVPVIRVLYLSWAKLPGVLRYDHQNLSWYLSEF